MQEEEERNWVMEWEVCMERRIDQKNKARVGGGLPEICDQCLGCWVDMVPVCVHVHSLGQWRRAVCYTTPPITLFHSMPVLSG